MPTTFADTFSGPQGLLIGAAVILFFIVRQFRSRRVLSLANLVAPAALLYFGFQGVHSLDATGWALLGLSTSLAVALGAARGVTFRVWTDARGEPMMQGTGLTVALWVATIAVKVALTFIEMELGLGAATSSLAQSLLPGAATVAAQLLVVYLRSQDQRAALSYRVS
jgi:hypothetical protein